MAEPSIIYCPFCGYKADGNIREYQIMLHLEEKHPEGPSPFIPRGGFEEVAFQGNDSEQTDYVDCNVPGCGEAVMLTELETHIMLHEFEDESDIPPSKKQRLSEDEITGSESPPAYHPTSQRIMSSSSSSVAGSRASNAPAEWKKILNMPKPTVHKSPYRRLGKSELGPYAHEDQMPAWLVKLLESDGATKQMTRIGSDAKLKKVAVSENWVSGIIPVLSQLLEQDSKTEYAYLCQPDVLHISKLKREGGFCGYRNIQMMFSNLKPLKLPGRHVFDGKVPTVFQIQDCIENAWDRGINVTGREETGGIKGTRKYIGTPDAQAMLLGLDIHCQASAFKANPPITVQERLFEAIEKYFANGYKRTHENRKSKVRQTQLPSVYFQHPGHSVTIIGIEKKTSGAMNLLVFDPMFHDSEKITKHIGQKSTFKAPADLLRAYRRGSDYLRKYKEFEILKLELPR